MNHEILAEEIITELEKAVNEEKEIRAQHLFSEAEELNWTLIPEHLNRRYRAAMNKLHLLTT